ncbi:MAG TPA: alpha/beta fold hydrolase [Oscillatoriaceae cyanobacterium]
MPLLETLSDSVRAAIPFITKPARCLLDRVDGTDARQAILGDTVEIDGKVVSAARDRALKAGTVPKRNPVVLVHGFVSPADWWNPIKGDLKKAGYKDFATFDYYPAITSLDGYSKRLKAVVEDLKARTGAKKVDILAHSEGGLVARNMVKKYGMSGEIDHMVMFGTPNHGTALTDIAAPLRPLLPSDWSEDAMTPGGKFLKALNRSDETPGRTKYTTITAGNDEIVFPHATVALKGATNLRVPGTFHIGMLYNKMARKLALRQLKA